MLSRLIMLLSSSLTLTLVSQPHHTPHTMLSQPHHAPQAPLRTARLEPGVLQLFLLGHQHTPPTRPLNTPHPGILQLLLLGHQHRRDLLLRLFGLRGHQRCL